jgi:hypothetical protein
MMVVQITRQHRYPALCPTVFLLQSEQELTALLHELPWE